MSDLTPREKVKLEKLFQMQDDNVMDFDDMEFAYFVGESINIDIRDSSKYMPIFRNAGYLREIWRIESNYDVGKLIGDLLSYYMDIAYWDSDDDRLDYEQKGEFSRRKSRLYDDCLRIKHRLLDDKYTSLPYSNNDTLQILADDINDSLERGVPQTIIDRLHVFATKILRDACVRHEIEVCSKDGTYYSLANLIAMLKNHYRDNSILESEFALVAIKNNIDIFAKYNSLRNEKSFAHDNNILNSIEADFAIKTIMNTLNFIDTIEKRLIYYNQQKEKQDFDLSNMPF